LPSTRIDRVADDGGGDEDAEDELDADDEELEDDFDADDEELDDDFEAELDELLGGARASAPLPAVAAGDEEEEEELPPQADRLPAISATEIQVQSRNVIYKLHPVAQG
jgi:hypothetical protein